MNIERTVMLFGGSVTLLGSLLAWFHSPYWLILTGLVGLNFIQTAFTGFCPLAIILKKLGKKTGSAF